jgi:hypothetical protein
MITRHGHGNRHGYGHGYGHGQGQGVETAGMEMEIDSKIVKTDNQFSRKINHLCLKTFTFQKAASVNF